MCRPTPKSTRPAPFTHPPAPRQTLLESGAKVNTPDVDGWLPLHVAAYYGAPEITRLLLSHKALVCGRSEGGWPGGRGSLLRGRLLSGGASRGRRNE
jgi:ankyrin repeat protein